MLLTLYLIALAIGGTLLVASLVLGGHADADADVDADVNVDAGAAAEVDVGGHEPHGDGLDAGDLLPVTSVRFWTFFLAFFGLTGTLLDGMHLVATPWLTLAIAIAVGWVCGAAMHAVYRRLRTEVVDSSITERDLLGASATVLLPVARGQTGKVRVAIAGRTVEFVADTEDDTAFAAKETAIIWKVEDDGRVWIARQ